MLSTVFFLLTLWTYCCYAERRGGRAEGRGPKAEGRPKSEVQSQPSASSIQQPASYCLCLLFFALGLMSKPMLVTLPFILLLLDFWPLRRITFTPSPHHPITPARRLVFEKLPFFALAVAMCWITVVAQERSGAVAELSVLPLPFRLANALVSYARYVMKMLWPQGLVPFYPRPQSWPGWQVAGAGALLVAVTVLVVRLARRRPYLAFGWLWYLGTLVPVIGLVQVGLQAMADRYTYIPLIGLFVMVAWGVGDVAMEWQLPQLVPGLAAGAALAGCLAVTRVQVQHWRNSITLFSHALAARPGVPLALNNLGSGLYDHDKFEEAVAPLKEALRLKPGYVDALNNLGLSYWRLGREELAIEQFTAVLNQGPDAKAYYNLGVVLFNQGKLDGARECFLGALQLQPDSAEVHNNLGNVLGSQGKMDEAGEQFAAAVRCAPDLVEAQCNLGRYFTDKGSPEKAAECYTAALLVRPDYAEAHNGLAKVLEQFGRLPEAAQHYAAAVQLQPNLAEAHNNLSNIAARQKDPQTALDHGLIAVRLRPDWAEAHFNLANALILQNKLPEAEAQYAEAVRLKPAYLEAHQNLGFVREKLGKDKEAAEQYAEVVRLRPEFAAAYNRLATVLARQGRFDEAIKAAKEGIRQATASGQNELANQLRDSLQRYNLKQTPIP